MINLFRKIRQKQLEDLPAGQEGNKIGNYLKYAIGEIYILIMSKSPFRDLIGVEQTIGQDNTVPLGTGYVGKTTLCKNHIAYLRHANSDYKSAFYRYFVPTGHSELQGSHKALNLRFL